MIEQWDEDGIAVLALAHGKANALDSELCRALVKRVDELEDGGARAIVMTGRGRSFSGGVDLMRILDDGPDYIDEFLPALEGMLERIAFAELPVVAAINGHAIAGGCVLACTADRRFTPQGNHRLGLTELAVGVPFPAVALEIMRYAVPRQHRDAVVYAATTFDPSAARERGLVDELTDSDGLMDRALTEAHWLAQLPSTSYSLTKRQLRSGLRRRAETAREQWGASIRDAWKSPETLEAIRSFVERHIKKG